MAFFSKKLELKKNISSVEEYFSLPKSEREVYGLYKTPLSLPVSSIFGLLNKKDKKLEGWSFFYSEIKKQYPIQYFIRHYLPSLENPIVYAWFKFIQWPIRDFKWALKLYLKPVHPRWRKTLPRHKYKDIVSLVVESNFAMILDFYYEEVIDGYVDWKADDPHKKFYIKLLENVRWISEEKTKEEKKLDEATSYALDNPIFDKNQKLDYYATYKHVDLLEEYISKRDTEILKWFIDNRNFFWT